MGVYFQAVVGVGIAIALAGLALASLRRTRSASRIGVTLLATGILLAAFPLVRFALAPSGPSGNPRPRVSLFGRWAAWQKIGIVTPLALSQTKSGVRLTVRAVAADAAALHVLLDAAPSRPEPAGKSKMRMVPKGMTLRDDTGRAHNLIRVTGEPGLAEADFEALSRPSRLTLSVGRVAVSQGKTTRFAGPWGFAFDIDPAAGLALSKSFVVGETYTKEGVPLRLGRMLVAPTETSLVLSQGQPNLVTGLVDGTPVVLNTARSPLLVEKIGMKDDRGRNYPAAWQITGPLAALPTGVGGAARRLTVTVRAVTGQFPVFRSTALGRMETGWAGRRTINKRVPVIAHADVVIERVHWRPGMMVLTASAPRGAGDRVVSILSSALVTDDGEIMWQETKPLDRFDAGKQRFTLRFPGFKPGRSYNWQLVSALASLEGPWVFNVDLTGKPSGATPLGPPDVYESAQDIPSLDFDTFLPSRLPSGAKMDAALSSPDGAGRLLSLTSREIPLTIDEKAMDEVAKSEFLALTSKDTDFTIDYWAAGTSRKEITRFSVGGRKWFAVKLTSLAEGGSQTFLLADIAGTFVKVTGVLPLAELKALAASMAPRS